MEEKFPTIIKRKNLVLPQEGLLESPIAEEHSIPETSPCLEDCTVLVINSSQDMAKEITMQLTLDIPGCSIMYAPTLELAKLLLRRRKIDLVVSSALLPDGNIGALKEILEKLDNPPDVVVVGNIAVETAGVLENSVYDITDFRRLGNSSPHKEQDSFKEEQPEELDTALSSLGADLRNDLNNPLQEIVAMVYVAQSVNGEVNSSTKQALRAIDKAAKNMAHVVGSLEDKIKSAVANPAQSDSEPCKIN